MGRGIVQHHNPKGVRIGVKQHVQVRADLLVPFAAMNGIQPLSRGIFQTAQKSVPGIRKPRRIHPYLGALGGITVADIRTPMEICCVKKPQSSGFAA